MSERASGAGLRLTLTIDLPPDGTPAREALNRRTIGELLGIEPKRSARVSGSVILRDEDGGEIPAARTAPEPWTPKPGDRVRIAEALKALERQEWIEEAKADLDYIPGTGWRLYVRGLGGWTTSGHDTAAAEIDAVMEKHPLTREGE